MNRTAAPIDNASFPRSHWRDALISDTSADDAAAVEDGDLRTSWMRNYEGYPRWGLQADIGLLIDDRDVDC